jgi:hypothetical protein
MARTASVLGQHPGIGERLGIVTICRCFGRRKIRKALRASGRETQRRRELSAELTIYYVISMALLMHVNLKEVLRCLFEGLRDAGHDAEIKITGKSGISQARTRLGCEPLRQLYADCVRPLATPKTRGAWYGRWRLVALDGTTLDIPDETVNRQAFGGPTTFNDRSPFPQIRFVTLAEIGTRVLFGAEMAGYTTSEVALARTVVTRLEPGMLCIADRGFFSFDMLQRVRAADADMLLRVRKDIVIPVGTLLPDGSYLSELNTWKRPKRGGKTVDKSIPVRVVTYRLDGVENDEEKYTLITTILDPEAAPAGDLARLYHERWEIETAFDELKTHLRGARLSLRSKTPELVRQEFYGLLLAHFAVRALMHEAGLEGDEDPDRLSFTHSLGVIRRKMGRMVTLSPSASA